MSRKPSPQIRYGAPRGARSATERRAETWIRQNSYSGHPIRISDGSGQNGHSTPNHNSQPANKPIDTSFVNLQRQAFQPGYYDQADFQPFQQHLNRLPRLKLISDYLGHGAIQRFGFEDAKERLEKAAAASRAIISFTAERVTTHSTGRYTFVGLNPEKGSRLLLEEDLETACREIEVPKIPDVRSLLVARFDNDDPNIDTAVELFNYYIGNDPAAEHALLAKPFVHSKQ